MKLPFSIALQAPKINYLESPKEKEWELNMQAGCFWVGKKELLFLYATLERFLLAINPKLMAGTDTS